MQAHVTFMNFDDKVHASAFFDDLGKVEPEAKVPCKSCGKCLSKPRSGYSTFVSHIDSQHAAVKEVTYARFQKNVVKVKGHMNSFVPMRSVFKFPLKLYSWMEWIIMGDLSFSWCEDKYARKYSNISTEGKGLSRNLKRSTSMKITNVLLCKYYKSLPTPSAECRCALAGTLIR